MKTFYRVVLVFNLILPPYMLCRAIWVWLFTSEPWHIGAVYLLFADMLLRNIEWLRDKAGL